jgi:hypothetical protein
MTTSTHAREQQKNLLDIWSHIEINEDNALSLYKQ